VDRFVEGLSLVLGAREDLWNGGMRETALTQAHGDRPHDRIVPEGASQLLEAPAGDSGAGLHHQWYHPVAEVLQAMLSQAQSLPSIRGNRDDDSLLVAALESCP
jgi:hypothetical protein